MSKAARTTKLWSCHSEKKVILVTPKSAKKFFVFERLLSPRPLGRPWTPEDDAQLLALISSKTESVLIVRETDNGGHKKTKNCSQSQVE